MSKPTYEELEKRVKELEKAEKVLLESLETYKTVTENVNVGITKINSNFEIIWINNTICEWFNTSLEEIIGKKCYKVFEKKDDVCFYCPAIKAISSGKPCESETEGVKPDGTHFTVRNRAFPILDEDGKVIGFNEIIEDITKRKKAEEALKEKIVELNSFINNIPDMAWLMDIESRYIATNTAYGKAVGKKPNKLINKGYEVCFGKKGGKKLREDDMEVIKSRKQTIIVEKINIGNNIIWLETIKSPMFDNSGKIIGIVGIARNITERKRAEEKLQEEKERAQNYLDIAGVIIAALNIKGEVSLINQKGSEVLCYPQDEIIGKNWFQNFLPERGREDVIRYFHLLIAGEIEAIEYYENSIETKYGEERYIAWHNCLLYDKSGMIIGTLSSGEDITERKRAEEAVKNSEKRYRTLYEQVPDLYISLDNKGIIIECNKFGAAHLGYNPEDLFGKHITSFFTEDSTARFSETFPEFLKKGKVKNTERSIIAKNGEIRQYVLNAEADYDSDGKPFRSRAIFHDITERKKAEEELKLNQYYFEKAQQIGSIGSWELDLRTNKLIWTDENYKVFGVPLGTELTYEIFLNCVHPDDREYVDRKWKAALKNEPYDIEHRLIVDGEIKWIREKAEVEFDKEGNCIRGIGFAQDITEHKQLEEERAKASKLESIGILAGGIAHDFNNILAVILGNASLAKISLDNKEEAVELLTETEKASVRATKLTQQLLTFAKGGSPVKETTELTELIRETVQFSLRGSNVQYRTSIPPDLWVADVDKGQISQVISNLVINAQQAMPEGGTINIKAKNVTVTPVDNLPLREGNYVKISLEDKGTGITENHLSKIFDPYFTTKQMGSGLGLATTYSIIHRHDGHIAVESELGVGTTFHIYLPASDEQVEGKETVKGESAVMSGKILVMDDEEMVRNILLKALESYGNDVDEASNGTEAIEKYKKAMDSGEPFDVVIMDLTIPGGMGGKQAIKKLLEIDPDAKAVVSSGYANDPVISNFEAYGFRGFIPKPYKLEEMKKLLAEILSD